MVIVVYNITSQYNPGKTQLAGAESVGAFWPLPSFSLKRKDVFSKDTNTDESILDITSPSKQKTTSTWRPIPQGLTMRTGSRLQSTGAGTRATQTSDGVTPCSTARTTQGLMSTLPLKKWLERAVERPLRTSSASE